MRNLARKLLAASQFASAPHTQEEVINEKLRLSLTRFAGAEGFASLLRRALLLASGEVPGLQSAKVGADGRLQGFEQLTLDTDTGVGEEAAVAITAHLLTMLVTFIGEPLTLRLVRAACSNTDVAE